MMSILFLGYDFRKEGIFVDWHNVKAFIVEKTGIAADAVETDTTFSSLLLDPLDIVELVMDLEDEFDIAIVEEAPFETVGDLAKCVMAN